MPLAIRVIDKVADLSDWDATTFFDGYYVIYDASSGKYIGVPSGGGGGGGAAASLTITGLNTSAVSGAGLFGYLSGNKVVSLADSSSILKAVAIGATTHTSGEIITHGLIPDAVFTTAGGQPSPGAKVFLAAASDDGGSGAGKLTATPPNTGVLTIVGVCLDNTNYSSSKKAAVIIQIREPIVL